MNQAQHMIVNEYLIDKFCDSVPQDFRYSVKQRFLKMADKFRELYGRDKDKRMDILLDFGVMLKQVKSAVHDYKRLRSKRAQNEAALQRHCERFSLRVYDYINEHSYAFNVSENTPKSEQLHALQGLGLVYGKIRSLAEADGFVKVPPLDWEKYLTDFADDEKEYHRDVLSFVIKATDPATWFRKYKREIRRQKEELARRLGFVSLYCSENALREQVATDKRNQMFLSGMEIERDDGERFSLDEVVKHSLANPANRHAQMMARVAGLERLGNELNYTPTFYTLTAPSKYHKKSDYYDNKTPGEAREHLQGVWEKVRSHINKLGVDWFFVRVAEAHKDGTPHWHLMVWVQPGRAQMLVDNAFKVYVMEDDNRELVNKDGFIRFVPPEKHRKKGVVFRTPRLEIKRMLPHLGHPTGYIIKYISKNIQRHDESKAPEEVTANADRVTTWARTHRIRQFQFGGDAKLGVWKEMRRLSDEVIKKEGLVLSEKAEQLRQYCRNNDWFNYVLMMDEYEIVIDKELMRSEETFSRKEVVKGVRFLGHGEDYQTRFHEWKKVVPEPAQAGAPPEASATAWSPYTNCTFEIKDESPLIEAKSEFDRRLYEFAPEITGMVAKGFDYDSVLDAVRRRKIPEILSEKYRSWAVTPDLLDSVVVKLQGVVSVHDLAGEYEAFGGMAGTFDDYVGGCLEQMAKEYLFDEYALDFFE